MIKRWYYKLSIARKLHLLLMLGCLISMVCFGFAYTYYGVHSLQASLLQETESMATLVGSRLGASIQFDNPEFATKKLRALGNDESYASICLYNAAGKVFAFYPAVVHCTPKDVQWNGSFKESAVIGSNYLSITKNILVDGEIIGAIKILRSTATIHNYLITQLKTMLAVTAFCLCLCYILANYLQKIISIPIMEIAKNAQDIIGQGSFSDRLHPRYSDELGQVAEAFNRILVLMNERYVELTNQHNNTTRAYGHTIAKIEHIADEFIEAIDTFLVFSQLTNKEMMGKEVINYKEYQKDVLDSLCFYQIKMESLKHLTNIYAQAIEQPKVQIDLRNYIANFATNLGQELPFVPVECRGQLSGKQYNPCFTGYKLAWDELFTLIRNMYSLLAGVVEFSAKITFDMPTGSSHLLLIYADSNIIKTKSTSFNRSEDRYELDEAPYTKNSIEDPNVADEFLDDDLLQRQDLKYIIDSIAYIAYANEIGLSHRFSPHKFVLELDLSARYATSPLFEYLVVS